MPDTPLDSTRLQRFRRGLWLTCVLLLVTGCTTVPERDPVTVQLPAAFSGTGTDLLPEHWWESFGDSVLDRLVEQALAAGSTPTPADRIAPPAGTRYSRPLPTG